MVLSVMRIQEVLYSIGTQMVRGDPMMISLVALIKRVVEEMALRQRGRYPHATGSLAIGCNTLWVDDGPLMFLGEYSKGIPFLLIHKKEKGELIIKIPKGRGFIKLFFKALKVVILVFPNNRVRFVVF